MIRNNIIKLSGLAAAHGCLVATLAGTVGCDAGPTKFSAVDRRTAPVRDGVEDPEVVGGESGDQVTDQSSIRTANAEPAAIPSDQAPGSAANSIEPPAAVVAESATATATSTEAVAAETTRTSPDPAGVTVPVYTPVPSDTSTNFTTLSRVFSPVSKSSETVLIDASGIDVTQELTQIVPTEARGTQFRQGMRPLQTDVFVQGRMGTVISQQFTQKDAGIVDILVVVDNSVSMGAEQGALAPNLAALLTYVADTNWQIGIVTTDPADGCLATLIRRGDVEAAGRFFSTVNGFGTGGSSNERGLLTAVMSLSGNRRVINQPCLANTWIRSGSHVAVLIVSDEDNCSRAADANCGTVDAFGKSYQQGSYLLDYLASLRPAGGYRVHGLISSPWLCSTAKNEGVVYAQVIAATGGTKGSICTGDYPVASDVYKAPLEAISRDIAVTLEKKFSLAATPDANSLTVKVNGVLVTSGVTLDGSSFSVAPPPPLGAIIDVTYTAGAVPRVTDFSLVEMPIVASLSVHVNGVEAAQTQYAFDAATKTIKFQAPPPDSAQIVATYRRDVALPRDFAIQAVPISGALDGVTIEGVPVTSFQYSRATGMLTFDVPPGENALIAARWTELGVPVLIYPFILGVDARKALKVVDKLTKNPIALKRNEPDIVEFAPEDVVRGRAVLLSYKEKGAEFDSYLLPRPPLAGTVVVKADDLPCNEPVKIIDRTVTGACLLQALTKVVIDYEYIVGIQRQFAMPDLLSPEDWRWDVLINNVQTLDFTRAGNVVTVPPETQLEAGATVEIRVSQKTTVTSP